MGIVTVKGQATIPKAIRDYLNIMPGKTKVEFVVVDNHVELISSTNSNPFEKARGLTANKMSTDTIMGLSRD